jgi:hypothetical protein
MTRRLDALTVCLWKVYRNRIANGTALPWREGHAEDVLIDAAAVEAQ